MPGLRVGWLTVHDPELYEQLRLAKFNSSIACGTLDEFLATQALARADQLLAARGALLAEARGIVERWIKAHTGRLRWLRPEAGAFCCMQLDPGTCHPCRSSTGSMRIWRGSGRRSPQVPGSATAPTSSGSASATSQRANLSWAWRSSAPRSRPPEVTGRTIRSIVSRQLFVISTQAKELIDHAT